MAALLSQGSSGPDVRQAQQKLNQAGASVLPRLVEDSVFGAKTRARVMEFQRSRALVPDGMVGPKTRGFVYGGVRSPISRRKTRPDPKV